MQASLAPLLRCMASDLWEGREAENGKIYLVHQYGSGSTLDFTHLVFTSSISRRPIVPTDWVRLLTYASRISVLGHENYVLKDEFIPQTSAEAFQVLSSSKPTLAPLCPNLHTLDWINLLNRPNDNKDVFSYIRPFLVPNLRDLGICWYGTDFTRISTILSLPRIYPGLTVVVICDYSDDDDEQSAYSHDTISDAVCQWNQLERFTWDIYLSHRALIHLAGLTKLQTINVSIPDLSIADWQAHLSILQKPGFCALQMAIITCKRISSCTSLIDIPSLRQLDSISIIVRDDPEVAAVGRLFQALNT